jgi:hypothetical protein
LRIGAIRVLWRLIKYKQPFDWNVFAKEEEKKKEAGPPPKLAAAMNFQLTPIA